MKADYLTSTAIRDSYRILPLQGVWTWLTGKELRGRKQLWKSNSIEMMLWSISWIIAGVSLISYALHLESIIVYMIGAILSSSGARYVVATIIHEGVHGTLFRNPRNNKLICEVLSTIFMVQPYESYRKFHVHEHHGKDFSTLNDQDLAAIHNLGFLPGKSPKFYYFTLLTQIINPLFHAKFLFGRIKSNLSRDNIARSTAAIIWMAILTAICIHIGGIKSLLFIFIPFVFMYQIASLLHLITEHTWELRGPGQTVRQSHVYHSHARFCGSKCPPSFAPRYALAWFKWALEHLFIHLPTRLLIVQGSLVCHDWHHRHGTNRRWFDFAKLREENAFELYSQKKYDYTEIWGFIPCLNYVFHTLSKKEAIVTAGLKYRLN